MGMYTELRFASALKDDTPEQVIRTLQMMVGDTGEPTPLPDHPLFSTDRWLYMLRCDSFYFDATTHSTLEYHQNTWYLTIQCNFKNYTDELEHFLDWIMPYVDKLSGEYIGHHMYEEDQEPTPIYAP